MSDCFGYKNPLWKKIESEILPFISKPGRYVGNELNAVIKDHSNKLKIALAFPDIYEIGMSYLGQQILYHILNQRDDCVAERVYQVWPDAEKRFKEKNIPLFSLETTTPIGQFDVIGFSLAYELHATGVLAMLDLAGIPLLAKDRQENDPLIIAGGPAILNPEPCSPFFDLMYLGDAEQSISEIADNLIAAKTKSRIDKIESLLSVEGVYIPSKYKAVYKENTFAKIKKTDDSAPDSVKFRTCGDLKPEYYPANPIIPFIETTHDRLSVEIMRGCTRGCRFCQAGFQYRPKRLRDAVDIQNQVYQSFLATGFEDITLLSLSSTDFPELEKLVAGMIPFISKHRLSFSLPSLRPGTLSSEMLHYLKQQRKSGITFAPEAGTQRLRDVLGKNISRDEILDGAKLAFENDWNLIKLYFMVGLPTESTEDIEGIIGLVKQLSSIARSMGGKKRINVTISPFCPKPGTPWQWEEQKPDSYFQEIFRTLARAIRNRNVKLKFHDPKIASLEGILGRGDRRIADVILKAYENGARLDGWSEHFNFDRWGKALTDCGFELDSLLQSRSTDSPLAWDHIIKGLSKKFLTSEKERSLMGEPPPGTEQFKKITDSQIGSFGRTQKRATNNQAPIITTKIRLKYSRNERLRFYSHLDIIRLFQRAIRRINLPVSYSQGFHPHMKLSFGPPLAIGYNSESEYLDIQLDSPFENRYLSNLSDTLPRGLQIQAYKLTMTGAESLTKVINSASYRVAIGLNENQKLQAGNLLGNSEIEITRIKKDVEKKFWLNDFLHEINSTDDGLEMLLKFSSGGFIRPNEVLTFGLGIDIDTALACVYNRTGQYKISGIHKVDPLDMV